MSLTINSGPAPAPTNSWEEKKEMATKFAVGIGASPIIAGAILCGGVPAAIGAGLGFGAVWLHAQSNPNTYPNQPIPTGPLALAAGASAGTFLGGPSALFGILAFGPLCVVTVPVGVGVGAYTLLSNN